MRRCTLACTIAGGVCLLLTACGGPRPDPRRPCETASPVAPSSCLALAAGAAGPIPVLPDYQGSWAGDFQVTACHESDDLVGFCRGFPIGAANPVTLQLTQRESSVEGAFTLGDVLIPVRGTIDSSGALRLADADTRQGRQRVGLRAATFSLASDGDLRGTFRTIWTRDGTAGRAGFNAELRFVSRPSTVSHRLPIPRGVTGRSRNTTG